MEEELGVKVGVDIRSASERKGRGPRRVFVGTALMECIVINGSDVTVSQDVSISRTSFDQFIVLSTFSKRD